jgi:hypothetical protein
MAEKQVPLSIVIRTVDRATAGIKAVNDRLDKLTKPARDFGKALKDLGEKSGLNSVVDGFRGVGGAVMDLVGKVALVGGVVGVAVAGLLSLVDHFDQLGDTAEKLGTSADFLAAIRYAAERAGAPIEGVDSALQALVTNMGAAKSGTGKMLKFLEEHVGHVFAQQIVHANSLEEALGLLADGMAKLPDAARRSKLAMATLGDPALAPLLARGSAGIQELLTKYHMLAGSQGEAAEAAGKTDDALKDLHASTDGVKAALITGLSPALTEIIDKLTKWLVARRPDVERWAKDFGEKLPGQIEKLVVWLDKAYTKAEKFIKQIGGLQTVALAVAAAITGPLIASIITLGIAMTSSPAGLVLAGLGALALGIGSIAASGPEDNPDVGVSNFAAGMTEGMGFDQTEFRRQEGETAALPTVEHPMIPTRALPTVAYPLIPQQRDANIKIHITGDTKGVRATIQPGSAANVDLSVGPQLMGYGP